MLRIACYVVRIAYCVISINQTTHYRVTLQWMRVMHKNAAWPRHAADNHASGSSNSVIFSRSSGVIFNARARWTGSKCSMRRGPMMGAVTSG